MPMCAKTSAVPGQDSKAKPIWASLLKGVVLLHTQVPGRIVGSFVESWNCTLDGQNPAPLTQQL